MTFFGLSSIVALGALCHLSLASDPQWVDEAVYPQEWELMRLYNELRADGYTCPDGTKYAPNDDAVEWNCGLWWASRLHSQDMANKNYFDHYGLDGETPWERAEAQGVVAHGENIAGGGNTAAWTLNQWKESNGHCNNMMGAQIKGMGIGYGYDADSDMHKYWTQLLSGDVVPADQKSCYPTTQAPIPTPMPTLGTPSPTFADNGSALDPMEVELLRLLNDARVNGYTCQGTTYYAGFLDEAEWNCGLWEAARAHSKEMAENDYFNNQGLDGSTYSERAVRHGADYGCTGFIMEGGSRAWEAFERFQNFACSYSMDADVKSVGFGYFNHGGVKRWTIMLSDEVPSDSLKTCYGDVDFNAVYVPEPTPQPTIEPTSEPTSRPGGICEITTLANNDYVGYSADGNAGITTVWSQNIVQEDGYFQIDWPLATLESGQATGYETNVADSTYALIGACGGTYGKNTCGAICKSLKTEIRDEWDVPCGQAYTDANALNLGPRLAYKRTEIQYSLVGWKDYRDTAGETGAMPHCQCKGTFACSSGTAPTPDPTAAPTPAPTASPTAAPTGNPTAAPTGNPTSAPSAEPTMKPTTAESVSCKDYTKKGDCRDNNECTWKNSKCLDKSKICPKQSKEKKCNKFNCNWDGAVCSWTVGGM